MHRGYIGKESMRVATKKSRIFVTPEEAKGVWDSQRQPTPATVARALNQAGQKVHSATIARWRAQNWRPVATRRDALDVAEDRLNAALPLLTGDPTSSIHSLLRMREAAKIIENLPDAELLRLQTRALAVAGIVTSLELARRTDALIPDRLEEHTILFRAVTLALKEVTLAFKVFAEHLNPAEQ